MYLREYMAPNQTLDRLTRSAISRMVQCEGPWRAPRHRSAFRYCFPDSRGFSTNSTGAWQHTHGPGATVLIAQISQ